MADTPQQELQFHPLASEYRMLEGAEFDELVASIRRDGQQIPIYTDAEGRIVDGRNRYRACLAAGVVPQIAPAPPTETADELRHRLEALNVFRRHLAPGERAKYADPSESARLAAEKLRVDEKTVRSTAEFSAVEQPGKAIGKDKKKRPKRKATPATRKAREQAVKKMAAEGATVREIAGALSLSIGTVHEDLHAAELEAKRKAERAAKVAAKQKDVAERSVLTGQFPVILADPPWSYHNSGFDASAASHFPTMAVDAICKFCVDGRPIRDIASADAVLFLWATNPLLPEALAVMSAWGFTYKTNYCWVKQRATPIGFYAYGQHELLLIGTRGNLPPTAAGIRPSVVNAEATEHSHKPEEFHGLIEGLFPAGPYAELFGRRPRVGWSVVGNEV